MSLTLKRRSIIASAGALLALAVVAGPSMAAEDHDHDHDHEHEHTGGTVATTPQTTGAASTMPTFTG